MARFCSSCGAQMADTATACPACVKAAGQAAGGGAAPAAQTQASGGLEQNIAAALCYLPIGPIPLIACICFLVLEPYRDNKFIKFHALQSLLTGVAFFVVFMVLGFFSAVLSAILGPLALLMVPFMWLLGLGGFALFLFLAFKAYSMQTLRLPVVGDMAAKQAGL